MSTIRTLDRAFSILRIVAKHPDGIGVNRVASELGLAKSTISRLLTTMDTWEIVERTEDNRYRIGPEPVRWIKPKSFTTLLPILARPVLEQVVQETGEAAALCVLKGFQVLYLDHVQSHQDIQVRDWTGEQIPAHVSSAGMVLLAYGEPEIIDMFLQQPLSPITPQSIVDPKQFRDYLLTVKRLEYAVSDEMYAENVFGLSVPISNQRGEVIAALNIYGPKFRLNSPNKQAEIIDKMKAAAKRLEVI